MYLSILKLSDGTIETEKLENRENIILHKGNLTYFPVLRTYFHFDINYNKSQRIENSYGRETIIVSKNLFRLNDHSSELQKDILSLQEFYKKSKQEIINTVKYLNKKRENHPTEEDIFSSLENAGSTLTKEEFEDLLCFIKSEGETIDVFGRAFSIVECEDCCDGEYRVHYVDLDKGDKK